MAFETKRVNAATRGVAHEPTMKVMLLLEKKKVLESKTLCFELYNIRSTSLQVIHVRNTGGNPIIRSLIWTQNESNIRFLSSRSRLEDFLNIC